MTNITVPMQMMKIDYFTFYTETIKNEIPKPVYDDVIPLNPNSTILVHLRLDDTANFPDFDGTSCANHYRKKLLNNESCDYMSMNGNNCQAPLSKEKLGNIIHLAKEDFPNRRVVLLTAPGSDASFLPYPVIKNDDESFDLFLLSVCKVIILSRSTFSLSGLVFNEDYEKAYIPMWGHAVCMGIDSIYDKMDRSRLHFFA